MRNPVLHGKKQWGEGGGGWRERTLGLFVKSFLPAFREKQHRNIFSHHTGQLAKFGWISLSRGTKNRHKCELVSTLQWHCELCTHFNL